MSGRGFALAELLVAVAVASLVITGLIWLQVDYVALARRIGDMGRPFAAGERLQRAAGQQARCQLPGGVLQLDGDKIVSITLVAPAGQAIPPADLVTVLHDGAKINVFAAGGGTAQFARPVQLLAATAALADGSPRPGWSAAAVETDGATVAVFAMRCDLPEICDYDSAANRCRGEH